MKQKAHMTPDEFQTYIASEVESIRSEIERLRYATEHGGGRMPGWDSDDLEVVLPQAAGERQGLPELHKP